ncbi:MAG TPA: hypothetical protein VLX92_03855 [Kofleriaceae bacterium]|nr:hypothetical protein [Kofleriaceae bacterium]
MSNRIAVIVAALALACTAARPAFADEDDPQPSAEQAEAAAEPAAPDPTFAGEPAQVEDQELAARPADQEMAPSLSPDKLREMTGVVRAKVLDKLERKMTAKAAQRMANIAMLIRWFSLLGVLLLAMPLVLRKRYPGRGAALVKYSALAAVTFVVTVNLFGMVVIGFRSAQAGLGAATNPQLKIATGFFDTIDHNADQFASLGKELFAPTLQQLMSDEDEQPAAVLIENGKKLIKDADVFVSIAHAFKKLDVVFAALPTVLLLVTMVLFVLAVKPTLLEIVRLPMSAGQDGAGAQVVKRALRRVGGELVATVCTLAVLVVLTLLAGLILGRVVGPALDALIGYFTLGVMYLQYVSGASSTLVFVMLASVILFLVLNLAAVIVSMTLYLGKAQKIFQRRFHDGVPLREHARFWKLGTLCVLVAQLVPWLYIAIAEWGIDKIDDKLTANVGDASQVPWTAIMLIGPLVLVIGFVVFFWGTRALRAVVFLARYKVPPR